MTYLIELRPKDAKKFIIDTKIISDIIQKKETVLKANNIKKPIPCNPLLKIEISLAKCERLGVFRER